MKKQLNPTLTYVLSVLGFLCCCFGGLGVLFSAPAYFVANSQINNTINNPDDYEGNLNAMKTAKTIALVVMVINILYLLFTIYRIYTIGWDELMQQSQEAMEMWQNN